MCVSLVAQHLSTTTNNTHTQADVIVCRPVSKRRGNPTPTAPAAGGSSSVALSLVASQSDARSSGTTSLHHTTHFCLASWSTDISNQSDTFSESNGCFPSLQRKHPCKLSCRTDNNYTTQHRLTPLPSRVVVSCLCSAHCHYYFNVVSTRQIILHYR